MSITVTLLYSLLLVDDLSTVRGYEDCYWLNSYLQLTGVTKTVISTDVGL